MYSPCHVWPGFTTKSKALRSRVTFQLDLHLSVGVFHTLMKGLLGKGGPLTRLQAHGNAVKKRATTENPCMMLDAILCHASPTVTCHMLITRPGALFVQLAVGLTGRHFIYDLLRMHRPLCDPPSQCPVPYFQDGRDVGRIDLAERTEPLFVNRDVYCWFNWWNSDW